MSQDKTATLTIRKLQASDAAAFLSVRLAGLKECPAAFGSSYAEEESHKVEDVAGRLPPTPDNSYFFLGAFTGEPRLAGIIAYQRNAKLKQRHGGSIYAAYVLPEYRRLGVGHALVSAAIEEVRSLSGMRFLQLWVGIENVQARAMYEKVGFKATGLLPAALCVDGKYYDEALMTLDLTAPR
ncbi:MAG: GNAT family N-acetyltransferase [Burkholderiales bacterium]|nr:GNAT family N-acetyltransferase [Burkholderiales bacterium]